MNEFEQRWYSWGELRAVGDEVARLLTAAGVTEGQTVAFAPRNRPWMVGAELGLVAARYTITMLYAFQGATGIARDVGRAGAAAVVAGADDFSPELLALVAEQGLAAIALTPTGAHFVAGAERSWRWPALRCRVPASHRPCRSRPTGFARGAPLRGR